MPNTVQLTQNGQPVFPLTDASVVSGISDVAKSGDYDDLENKPTIPDVTGKADKVSNATNGHLAGLDSNGNLTDSGKSASDFQPTIDATHKLSYNLLSDTPTIPAAQVQTDWNASSGMGVLLNKPNLATVATSGSYNDLSNKPNEVEANPTVPSGTTPTALTGLKIGNGYYGIDGAVSDVTVGGTSVVNNGVAVIPQIPTVASMSAADILAAVDAAWNIAMS